MFQVHHEIAQEAMPREGTRALPAFDLLRLDPLRLDLLLLIRP